jgi:signal peptidase I
MKCSPESEPGLLRLRGSVPPAHRRNVSIRKLVLPVLLSVAGIAITVLLLSGTVKVFHVPTGGMSPTVEPGDRVTATRVFNPAGKIRKGDLVVFDAPRANPRLAGKYIQRVAATQGDTVDLVDGRLHVNGKPLPDRNGKVPRGADPRAIGWTSPSYPHAVPPGQIFTLGDNHDNSLDSRYFGSFPVGAVTHRPDRVIFPLSRAGKIE